jgi:CTP synthase (UTP-ammonia lyase)
MTNLAARVAIVGDRSANVRAHSRIPLLIDALLQRESIAVDAYWVSTSDVADTDLSGFGGIWVAPGSPYASFDGALAAARAAREARIPYLGTCGGFQHAVLEYARNVCGIADAHHAEIAPNAEKLLLVPLACSLAGHEEPVMVVPGTLAARVVGPGRRTERYNCSFGLNPEYLDVLTGAGLRFSGFDDHGNVRIAELPAHPFYLATLFQPELAGDGTQPHPIIRAFAAAAAEQASRSGSIPVSA